MKLKYILTLAFIIAIELPLEILGLFIVPIALLFTKKEDEHLLKRTRRFEEAQDYYEGKIAAINADKDRRKEHFKEHLKNKESKRILKTVRTFNPFKRVKYAL